MNLSGLPLRYLQYIVAVACSGSFVETAEQCTVALPSLLLQIRKLEVQLETVTVDRASRRLSVTLEGQNSPTGCGGYWSKPRAPDACVAIVTV